MQGIPWIHQIPAATTVEEVNFTPPAHHMLHCIYLLCILVKCDFGGLYMLLKGGRSFIETATIDQNEKVEEGFKRFP